MTSKSLGSTPRAFSSRRETRAIFGQSSGPFAVGKFVTATAFMNGAVKQVPGKDGKPFNAYRTWFNLTKLEPAEASAAPAIEPASDAMGEDTPF